MGKGSRNRNERAEGTENSNEVKLSKKELTLRKERKKKAGKICVLVCIGVIILSLIAGLIVSLVNRTPKLKNIIVAKNDYYTIDASMTAYMIYSYYSSYVSQYSDYIGYVGVNGLDTTKSLHEQNYSAEQTWFDYFKEAAEDQLSEYMVMASIAKEKGYTITDENQKTIDDYMASLTSSAVSNQYADLDSYLSDKLCRGVDSKSVERVLELNVMAANYYEDYKDEIESAYTSDDYTKYAADHPEKIKQFDYLSYTFNADYAANATDAEKTAAIEKAKSNADSLAAIKDVDQFKTKLAEYCAQKDKDEAAQATTPTTPSTEEVDHIAENTVTGAYYSDSDLGKWALDDSRAVGDITVIENKSNDTVTGYTVYMLLKTVYQNDDQTRNVRHILFTETTYETIDAAKAKAEEVYGVWKNGDATVESFAALAEEYSTDTGSSTDGGRYDEVYSGEMLSEFNDWLFDSNRKVGDTDIIKTDAGIHIVYYEGEGNLTGWQSYMRSSMISEDYKALLEENAKYKAEFDEEKVALIP